MVKTTIKKLDAVLGNLSNADKTEPPVRTCIRIHKELIETKLDIQVIEVWHILNKIVKDGYAEKTLQPGTDNIHVFGINFDGVILYQNGGHEAKFSHDAADDLKRDLEINRLKTLDAHAEENQIRLNRLTFWLAVGTLALALIELIKFLIEIRDH